MRKTDFATLAEVAERIQLRALTEYANLRRRDTALCAEIADLGATLSAEGGAVAPGDLSSAQAFQNFASIAARRTDRLLMERRALAPDLETARRKAIHAHSRLEAIALLAASQRAEERQRQARAAERTPGGS